MAQKVDNCEEIPGRGEVKLSMTGPEEKLYKEPCVQRFAPIDRPTMELKSYLLVVCIFAIARASPLDGDLHTDSGE